MKILFDTNVILDALLRRKPYDEAAIKLIDSLEQGKIKGVLCATSLTTIYYILAKTIGHKRTMDSLRDLMAMFEIAPVDQNILARALSLGFADFEDAVIHEAARQANATIIVSRDAKGFAGATIPVYSPTDPIES
ncbi:PIN domain-containing protein [bacterium]|nr:PIN domain-containing protein [bacterium]